MLTNSDLIWLLNNLPKELVQSIIAAYNPSCLFILDAEQLLNYNWATQCKLSFGVSHNTLMSLRRQASERSRATLFAYHNLCQRFNPQINRQMSKYNHHYIQRAMTSILKHNLDTIVQETDIAQIAYGSEHAVILKIDGAVLTTGSDAHGQLGIESEKADTVQIACGEHHTVILKADGTIMSCGSNAYGQLGLGDEKMRSKFTPVPYVPNDVVKIACGKDHTIIMRANGVLMGCGSNAYGQLGLGSTRNIHKFTEIPDLPRNIAQIAGGYHTILLLDDGTLMGCGLNSDGQLGLADKKNRAIFEKINCTKPVTKVCCGGWHTVAITSCGTLMSCGFNGYGQLGRNGIHTTTLSEIPDLSNIIDVECGGWNTLVMRSDESVLFCGYRWSKNINNTYTAFVPVDN